MAEWHDLESSSNEGGMKLSTLVIATMTALTLTTTADAHEFYEQSCCSERDCHPARSELFAAKGDKWYYLNQEIPRVLPSPDGQYHICESPQMRIVLCGYIPLPSM